jgi:hypothetical protein
MWSVIQGVVTVGGRAKPSFCSFYLAVEGSLRIPQLTHSFTTKWCCTYDLNSHPKSPRFSRSFYMISSTWFSPTPALRFYETLGLFNDYGVRHYRA